MKWSGVKAAQSCPTVCDPMDYAVYGILQARLLEWVAIPFSRGYSQPRDWTQVSHITGRFFTIVKNILTIVYLSNSETLTSILFMIYHPSKVSKMSFAVFFLFPDSGSHTAFSCHILLASLTWNCSSNIVFHINTVKKIFWGFVWLCWVFTDAWSCL